MTITKYVRENGLLRRGLTDDDGVRMAQIALRAAGHQLVADGDFGGITYEAVRRFQAASGLAVDGIVGAGETAPALDAVVVSPPAEGPTEPVLQSSLEAAPWLSVMRALTGTREIPGARSNPLILQWRDEIIAKFPDLRPNLNWYVNDDTPWCGLAVAFALADAGYKPASAPLWALNNGGQWVREGSAVKLDGPALGAVVTMRRSGGGHVTLYEGQDDTHWFGRGGNQSNMINVARFPKSRPIEGYYWPRGHPLPKVGPVRVSFADAVAGSEA